MLASETARVCEKRTKRLTKLPSATSETISAPSAM